MRVSRLPAPPLVAGGYFVTRPTGYLYRAGRGSVLSLSCDSYHIPGHWCVRWQTSGEELRKGADFFSLDDRQVADLLEWTDPLAVRGYTEERFYDLPGLFPRLGDALAFSSRFLAHLPDCVVLGLALAPGDADTLIEDHRQMGVVTPVSELVGRREGVDGGGHVIGFTPLGLDLGGVVIHSHLCTGDQADVDACGPLNQFGLFERLEEARAFAERMTPGGEGAMNSFWLAWQVTLYPIPMHTG